MNSRIKEVRKYKHLSQKEMANTLGITQAGVSYIEQDGSNVKPSIIKSICSAFDVNEIWLMTGNGEMFDTSEQFNLNDYVKERGMSELELEIIKIYLELDPDVRHNILDHFKNRLISYDNAATKEESTGNTGFIEPTTEDLEAEYKKIILNQQSEQAVTASSFTNGSSAKVAE